MKLRNLLSVDFDFFVREDPLWDWGHSENQTMFLQYVWDVRYSMENLFDYCNIKKYADFDPGNLTAYMISKGFHFRPGCKFYIAESHKEAYKVCQELKKCRVYNFDAHHDLWRERKEVDCANWLFKAVEDGLVKYVHWIAPSWSEEFNSGDEYWFNGNPEYSKFINGHYYKYFKSNPVMIDAIFLCRSGAWVPPHLDNKFMDMARDCATFFGSPKFMDRMIIRKHPSKADCGVSVARHKKLIEEMIRKNKEGSNAKASV